MGRYKIAGLLEKKGITGDTVIEETENCGRTRIYGRKKGIIGVT